MNTHDTAKRSEPEALLSVLPEGPRDLLINNLTREVACWFRSRAEKVLEAPQEFGPDLHEIRWQICGAFGEDLHHDYGDAIEERIEEAYKDAGLPTGVPKRPVHSSPQAGQSTSA